MSIVKKEVTVHFKDEDGVNSERKETREYNEIKIGEFVFLVNPESKTFDVPRDFVWRVGEVVIHDVYDLSNDAEPVIINTYSYTITQQDIEEHKEINGMY